MARILLISCNTTREPYPVYPLGMTMVAAASRARGHDVAEWDVNVHGGFGEALENFTKRFQPDYIGLSLRNVDSANFNKPDAYIEDYRKIIQSVRRVSGAPLILGGSAYTIFPEEMLEALEADYGVAGEGEEVFNDLIDLLETDPDTAYTIYHNNPQLSSPDFSTSYRHEELSRFYLHHGGMLNVQTKRGCPHRCAYCSYPVLEGRCYRYRQPGDVVDEIEILIRQYQTDFYTIVDSVFNDAQNKYLEIAEELVRRDIRTPWMCFLRPDNFTEEEAALLCRSGLSAVEWGTDCASDTTLKAMRKDFNWDQVVHSNHLFARHGVSNAHFIIFGGPGETPQTVSEGLHNLQHLEKCVIFAGIGVRIFPETAVYEWAIEEGKITTDQNLLAPIYYFSDQVDTERMHEEIMQAFQGRMDRIYPDGQYVEAASAYHKLGNRGPAWDMLLKRNISR